MTNLSSAKFKSRAIQRSVSTDLSSPVRGRANYLSKCTANLNADGSANTQAASGTSSTSTLTPLHLQLKCLSDTNLLSSFLAKSTLILNRRECFLDGNPNSNLVNIKYNIVESVHRKDWVGVYHCGDEPNPNNRLDFKLRCQNNDAVLINKGDFVWNVGDLQLPFFTGATTIDICFQYYQVENKKQLLLATSDILTVHRSQEQCKRTVNQVITSPTVSKSTIPFKNSLTPHHKFIVIQLTDLRVQGLRSSNFFSLITYLKFTVEPGRRSCDAELIHSMAAPSQHHNVIQKTSHSNGTNPVWSEMISLKILLTDKLIISVKNKSGNFPTMKRSLGEVVLSAKSIVYYIDNDVQPDHYTLTSHCPADSVSGTLSFHASIVELPNTESDTISLRSTTEDNIPLITHATTNVISSKYPALEHRPATTPNNYECLADFTSKRSVAPPTSTPLETSRSVSLELLSRGRVQDHQGVAESPVNQADFIENTAFPSCCSPGDLGAQIPFIQCNSSNIIPPEDGTSMGRTKTTPRQQEVIYSELVFDKQCTDNRSRSPPNEERTLYSETLFPLDPKPPLPRTASPSRRPLNLPVAFPSSNPSTTTPVVIIRDSPVSSPVTILRERPKGSFFDEVRLSPVKASPPISRYFPHKGTQPSSDDLDVRVLNESRDSDSDIIPLQVAPPIPVHRAPPALPKTSRPRLRHAPDIPPRATATPICQSSSTTSDVSASSSHTSAVSTYLSSVASTSTPAATIEDSHSSGEDVAVAEIVVEDHYDDVDSPEVLPKQRRHAPDVPALPTLRVSRSPSPPLILPRKACATTDLTQRNNLNSPVRITIDHGVYTGETDIHIDSLVPPPLSSTPSTPTTSPIISDEQAPPLHDDTTVASTSSAPSFVAPPLPPPTSHPPSITSGPSSSTEPGTSQETSGQPSNAESPSTTSDLPNGWEKRFDMHGRSYYIDHIERKTTWTKPAPNTSVVPVTPVAKGEPTITRPRPVRSASISVEDRHQLESRYQSVNRTLSQLDEVDNSLLSNVLHQRNNRRKTQINRTLPAYKFLMSPEILMLIEDNNSTQDFNLFYTNNVKHIITKIRREPNQFNKYQHNIELVKFLNFFANTNAQLPHGWEQKKCSAKPFFLDHTTKTTTYIDPRLPHSRPSQRSQTWRQDINRERTNSTDNDDQDSLSNRIGNQNVAMTDNEKVIAFLRQPNADEMISQTNPSPRLLTKINRIRKEGVSILKRYSEDIDIIIFLSTFDEEIDNFIPQIHLLSPVGSPENSPYMNRSNMIPSPYRRDYQAKLKSFRRKMEARGYGQGPSKFKMCVRRENILEDAFTRIMKENRRDLQRNKLYISFANEEGLDYGGPSREFFFLLSKELFNPYYGLFEYSANDTYTVQISPMSTFVDNANQWFRFAGRVLGMAIVHQYLLGVFFTRHFYKCLLGIKYNVFTLDDIESIDAEYHNSLLWIKENDISELDLGLTFSVDEEVFGQVTQRELKKNGANITVTESNKKDYINRMVQWRLDRSVSEQRDSLVKGFHEIVDERLLQAFDAKELELVTSGTVEIDIKEWRLYTDYRSGYHDQHIVVQWFWKAVKSYDNERRLRLLQFVTGTSSIPYEGFSALRGSHGPRKFCIEKLGKITALPRSHTCFNRLDLPPYTSYEMLLEKLSIAVEETSTFGIE